MTSASCGRPGDRSRQRRSVSSGTFWWRITCSRTNGSSRVPRDRVDLLPVGSALDQESGTARRAATVAKRRPGRCRDLLVLGLPATGRSARSLIVAIEREEPAGRELPDLERRLPGPKKRDEIVGAPPDSSAKERVSPRASRGQGKIADDLAGSAEPVERPPVDRDPHTARVSERQHESLRVPRSDCVSPRRTRPRRGRSVRLRRSSSRSRRRIRAGERSKRARSRSERRPSRDRNGDGLRRGSAASARSRRRRSSTRPGRSRARTIFAGAARGRGAAGGR